MQLVELFNAFKPLKWDINPFVYVPLQSYLVF